MNRPLHIWSVFAVCAAVLLAAVTWVTATAWRLQRAQTEAQQQAQFEEKVRLALWRMDSLLAPIVVQESSWPYFVYNSFYPAERAYNRMLDDLQPGEVLIPSPLLTQTSTNVLLHFQFEPDGKLTSPQIPEAQIRLNKASSVSSEMLATNRARLEQLQSLVTHAALLAICPPAMKRSNDMSWMAQAPAVPTTVGNLAISAASRQQQEISALRAAQVFQNNVELQARAQSYQQALNVNVDNGMAAARRSKVSEGAMKPIWIRDELVLARRVTVGGRDYIQGLWLDWPNLRRTLLESTRDLLPAAQMEPVRGTPEIGTARLLAALPVMLVPGEPRTFSSNTISPLRFAIAAAWACMLLAAVAVGFLLYGAVSLSERRGAFVSAVTHEMRTPLTTFKMYSEMLAEGMVSDEAMRKQYLNTLCSEANRLSHLVENVLAYARLERGSARSRVERVTLGSLIKRIAIPLRERAARAEMKLVVDADETALATVVHVDTAAVEQILFNLVDNACKYAGPNATEKLIHLEALPDGRFAMLRVRDHGQGISAEGAKRLFRPFSKSAQEAAHSAPGIGLGLALCRRLSRSIGGDLRLARTDRGACFELRLPLSAKGDAAALSSI